MALRIGSRELKNRLARYLQLAREGRTIVITLRGEPVAELRPLSRDGDSLDAVLNRLADQGMLSRGRVGVFEDFRPTWPDVDLSTAIIEDREDRF